MENKKNLIISILSGIMAVLLIVAFILGLINQSKSGDSKIMKDFESAFNSKKRTVIYYASSECGYCELQTPILETLAEDYDIKYLDIDITKLSSNQKKEITDKLNIEGSTPTTIVVENGEVVDTKVGYTEGKEYVKFFIGAGILPKDAVYSKEQYINTIDFNEYNNLISEGLHVIVIGQTGCSHCTAIKPALNSVGKDYKVTINYLNLTDLTEDENSEFFDSLKEIEYNDPAFLEDGSFGTPLTLVVEDGKVKSYLSGEKTPSQLVREFKKQGLID